MIGAFGALQVAILEHYGWWVWGVKRTFFKYK
jgi:hypothetical protein